MIYLPLKPLKLITLNKRLQIRLTVNHNVRSMFCINRCEQI